MKTLCNFPMFAFSFKLPNLLALLPIPNLEIKLPFEFPPHCPLD